MELYTPAQLDGIPGDEEPASAQIDSSLPPADRGKQAWLVLAGGFAVEAISWGFPISFGVFQEYWTSHHTFSTSSGISAIGSTELSVMYLGSPITFILLHFYPQIRRVSAAIGLAFMALGLVASSFSTAIWHLITTQGVFYGIGGSLLYFSVVLFLNEWFISRKGTSGSMSPQLKH
ncbi:MAG: hypothetical protein Q9227_000974 [Pyrenula ochraceoflavens]